MGQTFVGGDGMNLFDLVAARKLSGGGGGGGDVSVDALSVTENGTYSASSGHAYSPVTVSVPVGVFPSGTSAITANGIYDITNFASVDVNVSGGGGGGHDDEDGLVTRTLSEYSNDRVATIGSQAFYFNQTLTAISFLNVQTIYTSAFNFCKGLKRISFPNLQTIYSDAFAYCSYLESVFLPNAEIISSTAFRGCSSLSTVSFPNAKSFYQSVFTNCNLLMSVYLLSTSAATLSNANAFYSTPMSNSTYTGSFGSIYVPASLVDSYKAASNWSRYADRITSYVE